MNNALEPSTQRQNREPDVSFKGLVRSSATLANFILTELEKDREELEKKKKSRYAAYEFKPVSQEERQKIILAHQWVTSVRDTCSRILGVGNDHR